MKPRKLKYAGLLLFGKEHVLINHIPQYRFEALYHQQTFDDFQKNDLGVRYHDRQTFKCNVVNAYVGLMNFAYKHLPDKFYLAPNSTQRRDLRNLLFREVVGNLVAHSDYSYGTAGFFEIFSDKVITRNATRLIPSIKEGDISIKELSNYTKNPLLVKVLREIDWVEDLGSGARNIQIYGKLYSDDFEVNISNHTIFVMQLMYNKPDTTQSKIITEKDPEKDLEKDLERLTDNQKKILSIIENNPYITQGELSLLIGINPKNIRNNISKLKSAGLFTRIGPDKGGWWKVRKSGKKR